MTSRGGKDIHKNTQLRFIDRFGCMALSLDNNFREFYTGDEISELMRRKGVYSFKYMDKCKIFEEINLPLQNAFYSWLNTKNISDQYYEYAQ